MGGKFGEKLAHRSRDGQNDGGCQREDVDRLHIDMCRGSKTDVRSEFLLDYLKKFKVEELRCFLYASSCIAFRKAGCFKNKKHIHNSRFQYCDHISVSLE